MKPDKKEPEMSKGETSNQKNKPPHWLKSASIGLMISPIWMVLFPEQALAAAVLDLTAAGKAMFNPIVTFIDAWYGTGIFAAGVGGAVVAAGDLRTRAMGFGIGSVVAGLTLLGVKAGFDVKEVAMLGISNFV